MVNADRLLRDLRALDGSQDKIGALSSYMVLNMEDAKTCAKVWMSAVESAEAKRVLPLLYLANDVLQRTRSKSQAYVVELAKYFPAAFLIAATRAPSGADHYVRLATIWAERAVFSESFMARLRTTVEGAAGAASSGGGASQARKSRAATPSAQTPKPDAVDDADDAGNEGGVSGDVYNPFVFSSDVSPSHGGSSSVTAGGGAPLQSGSGTGAQGMNAGAEFSFESASVAVSEARRRARVTAVTSSLAAKEIPAKLRLAANVDTHADASAAMLARVGVIPDSDLEAAFAQVVGAERAARLAAEAARLDVTRRGATRLCLAMAIGDHATRMAEAAAEEASAAGIAATLGSLVARVQAGATVRLSRPSFASGTAQQTADETSASGARTAPQPQSALLATTVANDDLSALMVDDGDLAGVSYGAQSVDNDTDAAFDLLMADDGDLFGEDADEGDAKGGGAVATLSAPPPPSAPSGRGAPKRAADMSTATAAAAGAKRSRPGNESNVRSSFFMAPNRSGADATHALHQQLLGEDADDDVADDDEDDGKASAPLFNFDATGGAISKDKMWDPINKVWLSTTAQELESWRDH